MHLPKTLLCLGAVILGTVQISATTFLPAEAPPSISLASDAQAHSNIHTTTPAIISSLVVAPTASVVHGSNDSVCISRPPGFGPIPEHDDVLSFHNFSAFGEAAKQAPIPTDYSLVFENRKAAVLNSADLGYTELESYDTIKCAAQCNNNQNCSSFNIYFERTPSVYLGPECTDAPSITVIKCVLHGVFITEYRLVNFGSRTWDFTFAMAGSNGYNKGEDVISLGKRSTQVNLVLGLFILVGWLALWGWLSSSKPIKK